VRRRRTAQPRVREQRPKEFANSHAAISKSDRLGFPIELAARLLNLIEVFRCPHPYPAKGSEESSINLSAPPAAVFEVRGCT
jgi:hypothetical protein